MQMQIKIDEGAFLPEYAHDEDAGADIRTPVAFAVNAFGSAVIKTGVHVQIPRGYVGLLWSKSGLNVNHDITSTGVIDAGYTGEISVKLYNHGGTMRAFERGDKISQLLIVPVEHCEFVPVERIAGGARGDGGFGSTGR